MLNEIRCKYFSQSLPSFSIQKLKLGDTYICTLNELESKSGGVFSSIACGASRSYSQALLKAQSEYVERIAFEALSFPSSTGFAAYPFIFFKDIAKKYAQVAAYREALERYSWDEWIYNPSIAYELRNQVSKRNEAFFKGIQSEFSFHKLYIIQPQLIDLKVKLIFMYALLDEGLVCGGAASHNTTQAEQSALKELYMHAIGLYRIKSKGLKPTTVYEKRVEWISNQEKLLEDRLKQHGTLPVDVPYPTAFEDIPNHFHQAYVVQRCHFIGYDKNFLSSENELFI